MKLKKNIIVIIPALDKNRYSNYGDLHPWGGSTLLEWKISQVNKVKEIKDIYVATPNNSIKKECKRLGIKTFSRNKNESLSEFHFKISKSFKDNYLLFLNPTSPFLSTKIIEQVINIYDKVKNNYDSICTVQKKKDYFFYKKKSVNFNFSKQSTSRSSISPLLQLSNGMYLIKSKSCNRKKNIIGYKPYFFEIDWMSSLEINSLKDIKIYNFLINQYFEKN